MPIEWQQDNGFDAAKAQRKLIESAIGANEDKVDGWTVEVE